MPRKTTIDTVGRQEIHAFLKELKRAQDQSDSISKGMTIIGGVSLLVGFVNPIIGTALGAFSTYHSNKISNLAGMCRAYERQFETYKDYIQDGICESITITIEWESVSGNGYNGWVPRKLPTGQINQH
ncbi:hypothetical protein [Marinisporobacter balticus]|uniref:Uncharacterized protein n=1 Tax=Marinisporobacter balticus TaxID=2018667 RepID=A0A4R2KIN3_9FIRM|nr:hypothetical protein [Marinisporobacter balticus]TCO70419.1 hypothetical protein EV214_12639 [Marinisporobacter balticus]